MSSKGQHLVDGEGCRRVLASMKCLPLRLKPVEEQDSKLLWKWVNDFAVRKSSFQSELIPWEEHARWLSKKLDDPQCFQFIALDIKYKDQWGHPMIEYMKETNIQVGMRIDDCFTHCALGLIIAGFGALLLELKNIYKK